MKLIIIENGSPCPCCGEPLHDKSEEWLNALGLLINSMELDEVELTPIPIKPPPDAGINPPKPPKF